MKTTMLYSMLVLSIGLTACSKQKAGSTVDEKPEIQEIDGKQYYIYPLKDLWEIPVNLNTLGQPFLSGKGVTQLDAAPKTVKARVPNPRHPNQPDITYKPTEDDVNPEDATAAQEYDTYVARKLLPSAYLSNLNHPVGTNAATIQKAVAADSGVLGKVVRVPSINQISAYVNQQIMQELNADHTPDNPDNESPSSRQQVWTGSEKLDLMDERHWAGVLYFRHPASPMKKYFRVVAYLRADTGEIVISKLPTDVQDDRLLSPIVQNREVRINLADYQPWQREHDPRNREPEYSYERYWREEDPAVWGDAAGQQANVAATPQSDPAITQDSMDQDSSQPPSHQAMATDDNPYAEQDMGE